MKDFLTLLDVIGVLMIVILIFFVFGCSPQPCHGDVLATLADELPIQ